MGAWWKEFVLKGGFTRPKNLSAFALGVYDDSGKNGAALLVAIFWFALIHMAWKKVVLQKWALGSISPGPVRAVWSLPARAVWAEEGAANAALADPAEFLGWAQLHNVNQVWLTVRPILKPEPTKTAKHLDALCQMAATNGVSVYLLCLQDPGFLLKGNHWLAVQEIDQVYGLIEAVAPGFRPAGIIIDVEPHLLNKGGAYWSEHAAEGTKLFWPTGADSGYKDAAAILQQFLDLLAKPMPSPQQLLQNKYDPGMYSLRDRCAANNQTLGQFVNLCVTVPRWWMLGKGDDLEPTNSLDNIPFGVKVLEAGIDVAVMNYFAKNPAVEYEYATKWVDAATAAGQFAWIGLDFLQGDGDISYFPNLKKLEANLAGMDKKFAEDSGFATMAVYDAGSFQKGSL